MIYVKYEVSGHVEGKEIEPYFDERFLEEPKENYDYENEDSGFSPCAEWHHLKYRAVEVRPATQEEIEEEEREYQKIVDLCNSVNNGIEERKIQEKKQQEESLLRKQRELQLQNVTNDFLNLLEPKYFSKDFELDGKQYRMKITLK